MAGVSAAIPAGGLRERLGSVGNGPPQAPAAASAARRNAMALTRSMAVAFAANAAFRSRAGNR